MTAIKYLNFDLLIERSGDRFQARVLNSPAGQGSSHFTAPFSDLEIENFLLRVGRPRRSVRRLESPQTEAARAFGGRLFNAIFSEDVRVSLRTSQDEAERQGAGLRIRLHLNGVPELADLPWEFIYSPSLNRFLSLSVESPLVRYMELPERIRPLAIVPPLRVLAIISNPTDQEPLDVEREWANLRQAVSTLEQQGRLILERLETPTLAALQRQLRRAEYHILHFVGHGGFNEQAQDGMIMMEDERGRGRQVTGNDLGTILHDQRSLRLAVLNACEGARSSRADPFAGAAQSLVQQGIPAVIAMQFEISDEAAITFAQSFYESIADNYPVDAALAEARKAIFAGGNEIEWGTPVLYMRAPDGRIFDIDRASQPSSPTVAPAAFAHDEMPSPKPEKAGPDAQPREKVVRSASAGSPSEPRPSPAVVTPPAKPVQSKAHVAGRFPKWTMIIPGFAASLIAGAILFAAFGTRASTPTPILVLAPTVLAPATVTEIPTVAPSSTPLPASTPTPPQATAVPALAAPKGKIAVSVRMGDDSHTDDQAIWIMNLDGGETKQVLQRGSQPALSPDGSKIAYYHWNDGIFIANADGTDAPGKKVVGEFNVVGNIAWSHNGTMLAYTATRPNGVDPQITFVRLDGQKAAPSIAGRNPAWSPDDKEIVFNSCNDTKCGIFRVGLASSQGAIQLTTDNGELATWSPRGNRVVYQAQDNAGRKQLFVVNLDAPSNPKPLLEKPGNANHIDPAWSTDGNFLFYRSDEGGSWGIWQVAADSASSPVKLQLVDPLKQLSVGNIPAAVFPHDNTLSYADK